MSYVPDDHRYEKMVYRRCGSTRLFLPAISLGFWHNFGEDKPLQTQRELMRFAFDNGITHFDLANNYGPPEGEAERNVGQILKTDFAGLRDELIISSKAGWRDWPGPYGFGGSKKYLVASCDNSLERLGLDYVDIFYHHRPDPDTPIEETMGALDYLVRSGRALYVGISSYSASLTKKAQQIAKSLGTPLLIHQPSYSMLNRWIEDSLVETCSAEGMGMITFAPLAQGLLTDRYLNGIPEDSRAGMNKWLDDEEMSEENLNKVRSLNDIAKNRGQSLAQMAVAWILRPQKGGQVTSALVGASKVSQLEDNLGALENLEFSPDELEEIDKIVAGTALNIWSNATASKDA